jgi:hypothetical protein
MDPGADSTHALARAVERWLPWAIAAWLAAFAFRFADERLYADSGYYLARVINEGGFRIEHGRWALALSQVLPLLGSALGLPLKALILLHSLNNVAWLAGCMGFAIGVLRDRRAALLLALVHVAGLTHGLFCPIFELYYGVDLLVLFFAVHRSQRLSQRARTALLFITFLGAVTSHLFGAVLMVAAVVLTGTWKDRSLMRILVPLFALQGAVHALTLSPYERDHLSFLKRLDDASTWRAIGSPAALRDRGAYLIRHYPDILLLSLMAAAVRWRSGPRWQAPFVLGVLAALLVVIALKLPGTLHDRYLEQVNFVMAAWVIIALLTAASASKRFDSLAAIALLAVVGYRVQQAEWMASFYAMRTARIEAAVAEAQRRGLEKGIIRAPQYFGPPHDAIDLSWSTSVESLLLSAERGPDRTVSIITTDDLASPEVSGHLDAFVFRRWDVLDTAWLDRRYFSPPRGRYMPLP